MLTTNLPAPAGAVTLFDWEHRAAFTASHGQPYREFIGSSWRIPVSSTAETRWHVGPKGYEIVVEISGLQLADGSTRRWVVSYPARDCQMALPLSSARMLADSLAAAYTEAERMNEADR